VSGLLRHRLIFITGKGGVGKSTVAIALGLLGARRGLRTIVAELASQDRVQRTFAQDGAAAREVELTPGLFTISIDPQQAMDEYLRIKTGPLGQALGSTRVFQAFAMATPGMRELLSIGKVWELAQLERQTQAAPYDLVVVDAPATGHGVGILRTPQMFADIARVGPIARQGKSVARTIADREFTAIVAVATAEEMPVNETLLLSEMLEREGLALDAVILNALYPTRFDQAETDRLAGVLTRTRSRLTRSALSAALSEHARAECQSAQRDRLAQDLTAPLIELPYVFCEQLGVPELDGLADILDESL
jgi:anion-transporting  ArsA/GET3 family ATPase